MFHLAHRQTSDIVQSRPLVVVPAWNEAACLGETLAEVRRELPGIPVLVVDDGSVDATGRLARESGAHVATLPFNLGVGAAMRVGFRYALEHGHDAVVQLDADGQHRPADVVRLLQGLKHSDLVVGNRFANTGYEVSGARRLVMRLVARVVSSLAHHRLDDVTSGFKAVGPRLLPLYARDYPAEYLGDTIEALVITAKSGYTITQCPVDMRPRQGGAPSQRPVQAALYLGRAVFVLGLALVRRWPAPVEMLPPHVPHPRRA